MTDAMIPYPLLTGIPRTGLTTVYQAGDDGTYQAGHPGERFTDLGNGTILDRHLYSTPTMWVKTPHLMIPGPVGVAAENTIQVARGVWSNAVDYVAGDLVQGDGDPNDLFYVCILANGVSDTPQEPPNATYWVVTPWIGSAANLTTAGGMSWSDGLIAVEALDFAGYTDWRMPNVLELTSLRNFQSAAGASMHSPLAPVSGLYWWTSTTRTSSTTNAYAMLFGSYFSCAAQAKANAYPVMPVRGGRFNG